MNQNHSNRIRAAAFAAIEKLEQRRLLSSVVSTLVPDPVNAGKNTLKITGTTGEDYIYVYDNPAGNAASVFNDKNQNGVINTGELTTFTNANLDAIHIDSKQGNDRVIVELESNYDDASRTIEVDLSDGNDYFKFYSPEANQSVGFGAPDPTGADIVDHSNINMEIEGQEKNDTIDIDMSNTSIEQSAVTVNVDAGSGNDNVSFEAPDFSNGEGIGLLVKQMTALPDEAPPATLRTDLQLQVDLGSGTNHYTQDLNTVIGLATVSINILGGSGYDKISDNENFELLDDSTYNFTANLGDGNDYYDGDYDFGSQGIDIEEGSTATINLQGGNGNDRITVEGQDTDTVAPVIVQPQDTIPIQETSEIDGTLDIEAYGGNGNDTMDMFTDTDHAQFIATSETGEVRVILSGDYGNDKVRLFLGAPQGSTGDYDLSVLGAAGNDSVAAGFADESVIGPQATDSAVPAVMTVTFPSTVTFGPSNGIVLDGGRGTDKYDTDQFGFFLDEPTVNFIIRAVETLDSSLLPALPFIGP